jgi:PAS domain S-box-containing protein
MERTNGFEIDLYQQEQIFHSAFTYAPIGMAILTMDGQWIDVNPALCEFTGYSREELLQMTFQSITHPDDLSIDIPLACQLVNGEIRNYKVDKRYFHKLGHIVWASLSVSITRDISGQPLYFIAQVKDINERLQAIEKLRKSEQRYRALFNSIDEAFCIIEVQFDENNQPVDYLFLEMNAAFRQYNGLERIDVGKTVRELFPDIEKWWIDTYGEIALTGEAARFEKEFLSINHWFDVYAFRFGDSESRKVAILFDDITERKHVGFELEEMRQNLAQRVKELEAALAEVKILQGIVPICSYCKNIRNDKNFWVQVEDYISNYSDAQFSHGICPDCFVKGDFRSSK